MIESRLYFVFKILWQSKMNKSTPISQLPMTAPGNGNFVSEQQKQMVAQAQQAISSMSLPQSSHNVEVAAEDDLTIQEVLNQINNTSAPPQYIPPEQPTVQPPSPQPTYTQQYIQQVPFQTVSSPSVDLQSIYNLLQQQNQPQAMPVAENVTSVSGNVFEQFINMFADDIKLGVIIMATYAIVQFAPISKVLGNYIAIEKIPYHSIVINSILIALVVIFTRRILFK